MRVREILDSMTKSKRSSLFSLLPPHERIVDKGLMPHAIKKELERVCPGQGSSMVGKLTEELLKVKHVTIEHVFEVIGSLDVNQDYIAKSKTTERYLESIRKTRELIEPHMESALYDQVVEQGDIEGHPDIINDQVIFEVKTSTNLKSDWEYFALQLFAYAALSPSQSHVCLVLPLQETIFCHDVTTWSQRRRFLELMGEVVPSETRVEQFRRQFMLLLKYGIGRHINKQPRILSAVADLDPSVPYQIMVSNPRSSRMNVSDADVAASCYSLASRGVTMFTHASYALNLGRPVNDPTCRQDGDPTGELEGYHVANLRQELQVARAMGAKGVVLHLGFHVKYTREEATRYMWENIHSVLPDASVDCPLMLETGVGEKSELVWQLEEFTAFVKSFNDPRLRVCLDTCHVHAAGYEIVPFLAEVADLVRLVHYNDSKTPRGSHRDLHECIGAGTIGMDALIEVAEICTEMGIPMVRE